MSTQDVEEGCVCGLEIMGSPPQVGGRPRSQPVPLWAAQGAPAEPWPRFQPFSTFNRPTNWMTNWPTNKNITIITITMNVTITITVLPRRRWSAWRPSRATSRMNWKQKVRDCYKKIYKSKQYHIFLPFPLKMLKSMQFFRAWTGHWYKIGKIVFESLFKSDRIGLISEEGH